jgi:hypothetical protein
MRVKSSGAAPSPNNRAQIEIRFGLAEAHQKGVEAGVLNLGLLGLVVVVVVGWGSYQLPVRNC